MDVALFALFTGAPFVVAMLIGIAVPFLLVASLRYWGLGLMLVAIHFLQENLFPELNGLRLGITLYLGDLVYGLLGLAAIIRHLGVASSLRRSWAWVVYVLVFVISLGIGLVSYGSPAGVQSRTFFYPMVACSYVLSFPFGRTEAERVLKWMVNLTLYLMLVSIYRWVVYYLPISALLPPTGSYNADGAIRVIWSDCVILMAQVLVMSMFSFFGARFPAALVARVWMPFIACAVLVLQHRSVWVAAIAGVLVALWCRRSRLAASGKQMLIIAAVVCAIAVPLSLSKSLGTIRNEVESSASAALGAQGSAGERIDSWQQLLKKWADGGAKSILIGQSFGGDQSRFVFDSDNGVYKRIDYAAHNFYVQTLFNLGTIGLGSFLIFFASTMRALYRMASGEQDDPIATCLFVVLAMQLVYDIPYAANALQFLILGTAFCYVRQRQPSRAVRQRVSKYQPARSVS